MGRTIMEILYVVFLASGIAIYYYFRKMLVRGIYKVTDNFNDELKNSLTKNKEKQEHTDKREKL